jgi:hypothetical protein
MKKLISVRVDEELWKATKHLAVDRDITLAHASEKPHTL